MSDKKKRSKAKLALTAEDNRALARQILAERYYGAMARARAAEEKEAAEAERRPQEAPDFGDERMRRAVDAAIEFMKSYGRGAAPGSGFIRGWTRPTETHGNAPKFAPDAPPTPRR